MTAATGQFRGPEKGNTTMTLWKIVLDIWSKLFNHDGDRPARRTAPSRLQDTSGGSTWSMTAAAQPDKFQHRLRPKAPLDRMPRPR